MKFDSLKVDMVFYDGARPDSEQAVIILEKHMDGIKVRILDIYGTEFTNRTKFIKMKDWDDPDSGGPNESYWNKPLWPGFGQCLIQGLFK